VQCWGYNADFELGTSQPQPDRLGASGVHFFADGASGSVAQIAGSVGAGTLAGNRQLSGYHTCALFTGGQVNCWGYGLDGQLNGQSTSSIAAVAWTASNVPSPAKAIGAGGYHSCAVGGDDRIYCWGNDNWAQLGSGNIRYGAQATTLVVAIPKARSVAAGAFHTCAVIANNDIRCWGANDWGQSGRRGGPNDYAATPVQPQL
jgi:alpha-tubulin suppressor-like RCC1 family protein